MLQRNKWYITAAEREAWRLMRERARPDEDETSDTGTLPEGDRTEEDESGQAYSNPIDEGSVGRHERDGAATTVSSNDFDDNRHGSNDHGTTVGLGPDQEGVTDSQAGAHGVENSTDFGPPIGEGHDLTPSEGCIQPHCSNGYHRVCKGEHRLEQRSRRRNEGQKSQR